MSINTSNTDRTNGVCLKRLDLYFVPRNMKRLVTQLNIDTSIFKYFTTLGAHINLEDILFVHMYVVIYFRNALDN